MDNLVRPVLVDDLSLDYNRDMGSGDVFKVFSGLRFWRKGLRKSLEAQVSELDTAYSSLKEELLFIGDDLYLLSGFEVHEGSVCVVLESKVTFGEYLLHWKYKDLQKRYGVNFLNNGRYKFRVMEATMIKLGFRMFKAAKL